MRVSLSVLSVIAAILAVFAQSGVLSASAAQKAADNNMNVGWRLLLDNQAKWWDDPLFLPDQVNLPSMPVNPPTGGWNSLTNTAGIPVTLPSTVEEHYWGQKPSGIARSGSPSDIVMADGNYIGVSWWYRHFKSPALKPGQRLVFSFPGARLRAEVYVNGHLVGYDIITESQFTADATDALNPSGDNLIAVRITNPGGRLDWMDFLTMNWGKYTMPATHAFGGIDGGVTMDVRGSVSVTDLAVFNHPEPRTVTLQAEVSSTGDSYDGPIAFTIERGGKRIWSGTTSAHIEKNGAATVSIDATALSARLWDIYHPELYQAKASLPSIAASDRVTTFGFRWFTAAGIGSDAKIMLNGRRIVPRSSISWGFWAPNGLFPDRAAANRDVAAVKALGLTSIQNHRHMPKPIVLDAFDKAGLLRYCEPGGGLFAITDQQGEKPSTQGPIDTTGAGGEPKSFLAQYELAKVLAMIKAERSHPSVSVWTLQNEISPNLKNPRIFYVLGKMREADPSRIVLLKSGIGVANQVWTLPYSKEWLHDDGTTYSGWSDEHTAMDLPGVYLDSMYKSPTDFKYRSDNTKEIVAWGEMATGASPDNHTADIAWHKANDNAPGYDLDAHVALEGAYNKFIDDYGFRKAFPTAESLFLGAGNKHYFSAGRILENARIANANDYIVLSGWESTSIEDHSGLTDSLRLLKGDPKPLKQASAPALLVVRPLNYVVAKGSNAVVDIHLINETNIHGNLILRVAASMDGAQERILDKSFPVTVTGGDTFGQLLQENISIPATHEGNLRITARLLKSDHDSKPILVKESDPILIVDTTPTPVTRTVAVAGSEEQITSALNKQFGISAIPFNDKTGKVDTILAASSSSQRKWLPSTVEVKTTNTTDPGLYQVQSYGAPSTLQTFHNLTPGKVKVELFFAETYFEQSGQRLFDVALNDNVVLKNFDICQEAGGADRALIKTFEVDLPTSDLKISIPKVELDNAQIAAIRISDTAGQIIREVFREKDYTDPSGSVWAAWPGTGSNWVGILSTALPKVQAGARLVLLTTGGDDAGAAAAELAKRNILTYDGMAGESGPSWLGFWYFGRKHWLLDGLPSDCVLDWPYQISNGNGVLINAPKIQAVIGYAKSHDAKIGIGAAVIPYGSGEIVLLSLPGLSSAFLNSDSRGFQPVTAKRIIYNAIQYDGLR